MSGAAYYDGQSTRRWEIQLERNADELLIRHPEWERRIHISQIRLERLPGGGGYVLHLAQGGRCEISAGALPPELQQLHAAQLGWLDFLHAHWAGALLALGVCLLLAAIAYFHGLPWFSRATAPLIPDSVVASLSRNTLAALDATRLAPSRLEAKARQQVENQWQRLDTRSQMPFPARLAFRDAPGMEANAFALPDGEIIVFDDLIRQLSAEELLAVLAHELGHVRHRHAVQQLIRTSVLAAASASLFGDYSSLATGLGTLLLTADYSREMEFEADDFSARQLSRLGLPPLLLASALGKLDPHPEEASLLASHPQTQERIRRLQAIFPG